MDFFTTYDLVDQETLDQHRETFNQHRLHAVQIVNEHQTLATIAVGLATIYFMPKSLRRLIVAMFVAVIYNLFTFKLGVLITGTYLLKPHVIPMLPVSSPHCDLTLSQDKLY